MNFPNVHVAAVEMQECLRCSRPFGLARPDKLAGSTVHPDSILKLCPACLRDFGPAPDAVRKLSARKFPFNLRAAAAAG
jgi:hypothetical protein